MSKTDRLRDLRESRDYLKLKLRLTEDMVRFKQERIDALTILVDLLKDQVKILEEQKQILLYERGGRG